MEVPVLEQVQVEHFVAEHFNFFLLQIGQLVFQVHHLFTLHFLGDNLPFLFELEALVIVLNTPFFAIRLDFSSRRLLSSFLLLLLDFFTEVSRLTAGETLSQAVPQAEAGSGAFFREEGRTSLGQQHSVCEEHLYSNSIIINNSAIESSS